MALLSMILTVAHMASGVQRLGPYRAVVGSEPRPGVVLNPGPWESYPPYSGPLSHMQDGQRGFLIVAGLSSHTPPRKGTMCCYCKYSSSASVRKAILFSAGPLRAASGLVLVQPYVTTTHALPTPKPEPNQEEA